MDLTASHFFYLGINLLQNVKQDEKEPKVKEILGKFL